MDPRFFPGPGQRVIEGHGHDLWWLHGLFALLIVVALVVGAVLIARLILDRWARPSTTSRHVAVEELDLRYARGEVDRAEYLQRRVDLLDRSATAAAGRPPQLPSGPPGPPGQ